jgi:suppressor for copper-sensitivity B
MFLSVVLWIFALNLWGEFEIMLPARIADKVQFSSHSLQSSFYAGAFATLLATPCTAPFITTSVAFAISRTYVEILGVYAVMGLGMAFPYYAIAASKNALKLIPKPGAWMSKLKKLFAVMILCTLGWLVYVLSFQVSGKSIAILVGGLVLVKFALTGFKRLTRKRILFLLMAAVIAVVLPMLMNEKDISKQMLINSSWEEFNEERLNEYVAQDRIVFIDVTAEWCLICKTNKFFVLDQEDFINHLKARDVVMMRADFTNRSPVISKFLEKNGRFGIPFNSVYSKKHPEGIHLPELLSRDDVYDAIEKATK